MHEAKARCWPPDTMTSASKRTNASLALANQFEAASMLIGIREGVPVKITYSGVKGQSAHESRKPRAGND
jgi:hypothetical protein